jgi:hypothetical protein
MTKQIIYQDNIGDVRFGDIVEKEFDLDDDIISRFDYWSSSCGQCTTLSIDEKRKKVIISINTNLSGVSPGNVLHKYAYIYLDKNINHYIGDKNRKMTDNTEKQRITYILTGNVI